MKVKKSYLAALVLPLAFAACSEEELVPNVPTVSLEDRETFDLVLSATKPSLFDGTTRLGINENNQFVWEKGTDVVGAALADGQDYGDVSSNNIFLNYPFTANDNATQSSFSGKSAVVYGTYFFHFPYVDHLKRGALSMNFPSAQKYTVPTKEDDLTSLQQVVKGMKLVSPLYQFENGVTFEGAATATHNVDFSNLYSVVEVKITPSNIKVDEVKVEKITLESTTDIISKATLKTDILATTKIVGTENAADLAAKMEGFYEKVYDQAIYNVTESSPIVLSVDELALEEGVVESVYVLVPKGAYNGLTLTVNTSEGVYTREISKVINLGIAEATVAEDDVDVVLDDILTIGAAIDFNDNGTGNVVLPESFDITSQLDWNNAVSFLKNHAIAYLNKDIEFNLKQDVTVDELPAFNLTIIGNKKLTLNCNYTITANNVSQFTADDVTLVVAAGKTLTLNVPMTGFNAVENKGTLNVNATQTKPITNFGTMNIAGTVILSGTIANGVAKIGNTPAQPAYINIASESEVTANFNNFAGTITVSGKLTTVTTNDDALVINKEAEVAGTLTNNGTLTHSGILSAAVNNYKNIEINNGAVGAANAITGYGDDAIITVRDVVDFADVMTDNEKKYIITDNKVTTVVNNAEEYHSANQVTSYLTYITLASGDWTLVDGELALEDDKLKKFNAPIAGITGLEFKGGKLTLNTDLTSDIDFTGATTINTGKKSGELFVAVTIAGNITNAANLVINNLVAVNTGLSHAYDAELNGNVTVMPGASMYFENVTVAQGKTLLVKGQELTATSNTEAAIFGVEATFTNNGTVQSCAGVNTKNNDAVAAGKVSQPTNTATGIFIGNATVVFLI